MFEKICIKSKELNDQKIDIAFLVETMLFYGNVVVLAHRDELLTLLKFFGADLLEELIITGRIDLQIRENKLGAMAFPGKRYNIDLVAGEKETYSGILYTAHRQFVNNSLKNNEFSSKFSKITKPYRYGAELTEQIRNDFDNQGLLSKVLPMYLKSVVPEFNLPNVVEIEIKKDKPFESLESYSLDTNINIDEVNELLKKKYKENYQPFDFGGLFLSLAEAKGDIYLASQFDSELVTSATSSEIIDLQFKNIIQRRTQSQDNINLFDEYVLKDCYSIGEAFVNGAVSKKELLKLFEKADKFRDWLNNVPDDKNLIGEYHNAVTKETFADKLPTKTSRFIIFEGIGITLDLLGTGGIGTAIATGLSAFDSFYLDKLIGGWKPNHFIDKSLKPKIKK